MAKHTLLIRADANTHIGTGHVMRCLALAQAWQDNGGTVTFLMAPGAPSLEQRIRSEGMDVHIVSEKPGSYNDAKFTGEYAKKNGSLWVVADGYHFGAKYQKKLKASGCRVLFIDDYGYCEHYYADLVLNQNMYADISNNQKAEIFTRFLLGTKYVLLRKEFLKWATYQRQIPEIATKVLITFGGGDSDNITQNVINALKHMTIKGLKVISVIGSVNPHSETLKQSVMKYPGFSIMTNVTNMPELMKWADVAISAGGGTCWELAFMGLPSIIIPTADNQKPNVALFKAKGLGKCIEMDDSSDSEVTAKKIMDFLMSPDERFSSSHLMRELIDGRGSYRVSLYMSLSIINMRPVEKSDCDLIFSWINDETVRVNSFHSEKISIEDHKKWFSSVITDKKHVYYIALDIFDRPIGQARFKIDGVEAVISILIDKDHRGMNLGSELIRLATKKIFDNSRIEKVHAYIKTANKTSLNAFISAGYISDGILTIEEKMTHHVIISRCG